MLSAARCDAPKMQERTSLNLVLQKTLFETWQLHQYDREVDDLQHWLEKCEETASSTDLGMTAYSALNFN